MSVFVDTSAFYALYDGDDANQDRAVRWLETHDDERLVTHAAVIAETTALIDRRLGIDATRTFLDELLPSIAVFHGTEMTYERALAAYRIGGGRRRPALVDCLAFETMRELRIHDVFTFDEHFERAGFRKLPAN